MGILSGLKSMGIDLKNDDLYEDNKSNKDAEAAAAAKAAAVEDAKKKSEEAKNRQVNEEEYLLSKSYTCPVCDGTFKSLTVKANRARVVSMDLDLRPVYDPIDSLKYNIVSCPNCGYSAFARNFPNIIASQKKVVREKVSSTFKPDPSVNDKKIYTYEESLGRYELALLTAMRTVSKTSEKAYLCLMMSWIVRGQRRMLSEDDAEYAAKLEEYRNDERELQQNALEGFAYARQTEGYPMCGSMDQYTVDYLIAVLYYKNREFDKALKMLPDILVSASANRRIKDKARDLKDKIMAIKQSGRTPEPDEIED